MGYCSATNTQVVLDALRFYRWGVVISPSNWRKPLEGLPYFIDNGAWAAHQAGKQADFGAFARMVELHGSAADFVVVPDIVAGGSSSLSLEWLPRLPAETLKLIAVQDGIGASDKLLLDALSTRSYGRVGLFVGGSTDWKMESLDSWGRLSRGARCHLHVGRVNSVAKINRCKLAGAHSIDGTSIIYSPKNARRLTAALRQETLFTAVS